MFIAVDETNNCLAANENSIAEKEEAKSAADGEKATTEEPGSLRSICSIRKVFDMFDPFDRTDQGAQSPEPPSMGNFYVLGGLVPPGSVLGGSGGHSTPVQFDRFFIDFDSIDN